MDLDAIEYTPQELADRVIEYADLLNAAVDSARELGLTVSIDDCGPAIHVEVTLEKVLARTFEPRFDLPGF